MPVMMIGDGMIGQMMEPVELPEMRELSDLPEKPWCLRGYDGTGERRIINSLRIQPDELEPYLDEMYRKYAAIEEKEVEVEEYCCEDAEIILTAYGTVARICKSAIELLRAQGVKVGLIRPITLFPFPKKSFEQYASRESVKRFISVELSMGQMIEDVKLAVNGKKPVDFYGRSGGNVMSEEEIANYVLGGNR